MTCTLCTCPNCMARYEAEAYAMNTARTARYEEYRSLYEDDKVLEQEYKALHPEYMTNDDIGKWLFTPYKIIATVLVIITMVTVGIFKATGVIP